MYIDLLVIRESITEKWIDIDTACRVIPMYTPLHYEQAT